jgi:quercetin dioxygenase-like cupin family protein
MPGLGYNGKNIEGDTEMNAENIAGKVLSLKALTDYQPDSIVSRTIVDKPSGTLTLFAFDRGQGLSEHTAPYDALVIVLDGEAEVTVAGRARPVKEGEVILLPADIPHAIRAAGRFKMMLVMIKS